MAFHPPFPSPQYKTIVELISSSFSTAKSSMKRRRKKSKTFYIFYKIYLFAAGAKKVFLPHSPFLAEGIMEFKVLLEREKVFLDG